MERLRFAAVSAPPQSLTTTATTHAALSSKLTAHLGYAVPLYGDLAEVDLPGALLPKEPEVIDLSRINAHEGAANGIHADGIAPGNDAVNARCVQSLARTTVNAACRDTH